MKLKDLWEEVVPGVFTARILTDDFLKRFSAEIERYRASGIPQRRPNSMLRYGFMINTNIEGLNKVI
jgi:hypothetical protein